MSAAATAAGYLYASGRLRGRGREGADQPHENAVDHGNEKAGEKAPRRQLRVAALPQEESPRVEKPKRTPRIEYRTRRWTPHG
jgi:hypothetical protein